MFVCYTLSRSRSDHKLGLIWSFRLFILSQINEYLAKTIDQVLESVQRAIYKSGISAQHVLCNNYHKRLIIGCI